MIKGARIEVAKAFCNSESGFPFNPDWVEKQARDLGGKERVR